MENIVKKEEFNPSKFIEEYRLNLSEYSLLGEDERIIYSDRLFGDLVNSLTKVGDSITIRTYMHPQFMKYFELAGCQMTNYDFGIEECVIKRVKPITHNLEIEDLENKTKRLDEFIYNIAVTKASIILDHLYDEKLNLDLCDIGKFYNSLDEELKYAYAEVLYGNLIDKALTVIRGKGLILNSGQRIPKCFDGYFLSRGIHIVRYNNKVSLNRVAEDKDKRNVSVATIERLIEKLTEREEIIASARNKANGYFSKDYITRIVEDNIMAINKIGEIGGLTVDEQIRIIDAELALIRDAIKNGKDVAVQWIPLSYLKVLENEMKITKKEGYAYLLSPKA